MKKQQKRWYATVGILLAIILALGITLGVATKWGKDVENLKPNHEQTKEPEDEASGGMILPGEVDGKGISVASALIPVAQYAENGISPLAETAYSLTATITPVDATNKEVDWAVAWVNPSDAWASGKSVTQYVTVTPTSDGALTANVECLQAFGAQIKVTVTSRENSAATADCTVDYVKRIESGSIAFSEGSGSVSVSKVGSTYVETDSSREKSIWASSVFTPILGVGTVSDSFSYVYSVTYTQEWIDALNEQGLDPQKTAGNKIIVESDSASDAICFGKGFGASALGDTNRRRVTGGTSSSVIDKFLSAIKAMNGQTAFTVEVVATGTYSTFTGTCACSASAEAFFISTGGVELNESALFF